MSEELTGTPWDTWNPYLDPEPYPVVVYHVAELCGLDPEVLDWHVEAKHGWEPHDEGYNNRVNEAARCELEGGCG